MIINQKEAQERLDSPKNLANRFKKVGSELTAPIVVKPMKDRGMTNLKPIERTTMAILAAEGGSTQKEIGAAFGIKQSEVSEIANGNVKGMDVKLVEAKQGEIRDAAMDKLMMSLGLLDENKLEKCKATELSKVASDMARVVQTTLPRETQTGAVLNLTIYAPTVKEEKQYKVVDI